MAVSITVTQGSTEIVGGSLSSLAYGRTIRINGDGIDNQIVSSTELLHPYVGPSGIAQAIIYSDSVTMPEPYSELVGNPRILDTGRELANKKIPVTWGVIKRIAPPRCYWVEANAQGAEGNPPALIRFDTLPDRDYRMQVEVTIAPSRVNFSDLLSPGPEIRLRAEHLESFLIPIARGILTASSFWKDKETKTAARDAAKEAESKYSLLAPRTLATPNNRTGTPHGF